MRTTGLDLRNGHLPAGKVNILGLNGPIKFEKDGPNGQESGQSTPNVYLVKIDSGKVTVPKI